VLHGVYLLLVFISDNTNSTVCDAGNDVLYRLICKGSIKTPVHPFLAISMHDNTEIIMDSLGPYAYAAVGFPGHSV